MNIMWMIVCFLGGIIIGIVTGHFRIFSVWQRYIMASFKCSKVEAGELLYDILVEFK